VASEILIFEARAMGSRPLIARLVLHPPLAAGVASHASSPAHPHGRSNRKR